MFNLKPHHRPLAAYHILSYICIGLLSVAFLFSLLVGLSLPIIKSIYLLKVQSTRADQPTTSIATELKFGVWGVCAVSALDTEECFGPQLGYSVPSNLIALANVSPDIVDAILKALLLILILHPIAAGLSFITLLSSLFLASHKLSILSLVLAIVTALVSSVVFAIDLALVIVAKKPDFEHRYRIALCDPVGKRTVSGPHRCPVDVAGRNHTICESVLLLRR